MCKVEMYFFVPSGGSKPVSVQYVWAFVKI